MAEHVARATFDLQIRERQDAFLEAYASLGNTTEAASAAGIHRETVRLWRRDNDLGFNERFIEANHAYGDYLKSLARQRLANPSGHVGGDILLIAGIAAHGNPEWRSYDTRSGGVVRAPVVQIVINAPGQRTELQHVVDAQVILPAEGPALDADDGLDASLHRPHQAFP